MPLHFHDSDVDLQFFDVFHLGDEVLLNLGDDVGHGSCQIIFDDAAFLHVVVDFCLNKELQQGS